MAWETVILEVQDGVAGVVMNRPGQYNALNSQLGDDLVEAMEYCVRGGRRSPRPGWTGSWMNTTTRGAGIRPPACPHRKR